MRAQSVTDTILGEAGGQSLAERYADMKAIASAIMNRAVYTGQTPESIVSAPGQFSAYGIDLPPGVDAYRNLAEQAWGEVTTSGPTHHGTFFATPRAVARLPGGLTPVTSTSAHRYFDDPKDRPINTADGVMPVDSRQKNLMRGYVAQVAKATPKEAKLTDKQASLTGYTSPFGVLGDRITSEFGPRTPPKTETGFGSSYHQGVDMSLQPGEQGYSVESAAGGTVTHAGPLNGYGSAVQVRDDNGVVSTYGHLANISVQEGQIIGRGIPVGVVGNTGTSTAPHLHFQMAKDGVAIDPRSMVDFDTASRVPTPISRPSFTPEVSNESLASALATKAASYAPAVAAIDAQMDTSGGWTPATPMSVARAPLGDISATAAAFDSNRFAGPTTASQTSIATRQAFNDAVAAQRDGFASTAVSGQAAKTNRFGAAPTSAEAGSFDTGRFGDDLSIASAPADFDTGRFGPTAATSSADFDMGRFGDTQATSSSAASFDRGRLSTPSEYSSAQVSRDNLASALNDQRDAFSDISARSLDGFMDTSLPGATAATQSQIGMYNPRDVSVTSVTTPEAISVASPLSASTVSAPIGGLSVTTNDGKSMSSDMGGIGGMTAADVKANPDIGMDDTSSPTGRVSPRAAQMIGGVIGSALGGPLGAVLGAMAGKSIAGKGLPAGGFGGPFGGLFGGTGFGNGGGRGPGGSKSSGSSSRGGYGAGDRAGGGVSSNGQGSRN